MLEKSAFTIVLCDILAVARDHSISEETLRLRVIEIAMRALNSETACAIEPVSAEPEKVVAWLYLWDLHSRQVRTKINEREVGFKEAIPLSTVPNGEIIAWRWCDGGGYNSDYRYSFSDPTEDADEVERMGADSVASCEPLYIHQAAKSYTN